MPVKTNAAGVKIWQLRSRYAQVMRWGLWMLAAIAFFPSWKMLSDQTTWFFVYDAPRIADDIGGRA